MSLAVQESEPVKTISDLAVGPSSIPDNPIDPSETASDEPFLDAGIDLKSKIFLDELDRRSMVYNEDVLRIPEEQEFVLIDTMDESRLPHFS